MLNFGGFLSSNFWTNYRCQSSASVEDLLNSKDCTVDKLLDDDDCLQEFKNFNDKLIKYFDHDKLKVLIDYITVMPDKDAGHSRGHKYPFISGEIFNCEINQILDKFFEEAIKIKAYDGAAPDAEATTDDKEDADDDKDSEEKKSDTEKDDEDSDDVAGDKKEEVKEKKKDETEEGAKDLEKEAAKEDDKEEKKEGEEPEKKAEEKEEETNPQEKGDDEAKVEEETKAEEKKDEAKDEVKAEKKEDAKAEDKDKNTQEPESEEQEKENKEEPVKEEAKAEEKKEEADEKKAEPEEEEPEKKAKEMVDDSSKETMETTQTTLATDANEDEDEGNKYVLLDRLFKFVKTVEQLNPVLSGYFCKLVSLLISRKQKQFVPYVFSPGSEIIEHLLKHVYQRSISEILNKLLTQIDSEFEPEIMAEIQLNQQMAISKLIAQLGPDHSEEHNLNASTILQDMFEMKDFYNIIFKKENVSQILDYATAPIDGATKASKTASLGVFNQIITQHIERLKKKETSKEDKDTNNDDDDDMIVQQNSDDEKDEDDASGANNNSSSATQAQSAMLVEILKEKFADIQTILRNDHDGVKIQGSVTDVQYVPLGRQRLLTVEMIKKVLQMRNETLYTVLGDSLIFENIFKLVKQYPWNNFLQLQVMNICEEVLDNCENAEFRKNFLKSSGVAQALIEMGENAMFTMESERKIRNGFMGLVVSISNKLQKKYEYNSTADKADDQTVVDYLQSVGDEWKEFVDNELKKSNERNNKTLGGCTKNNVDDDEEKEDSNYDDVQMQKIMARFTNFNSILSQGSSNDDDDDDDDDDDTQDDKDEKFEDDDETKNRRLSIGSSESDQGVKVQKSDIKEIEPLKTDFIDNNFWKVGAATPGEEYDVDALLAELDG